MTCKRLESCPEWIPMRDQNKWHSDPWCRSQSPRCNVDDNIASWGVLCHCPACLQRRYHRSPWRQWIRPARTIAIPDIKKEFYGKGISEVVVYLRYLRRSLHGASCVQKIWPDAGRLWLWGWSLAVSQAWLWDVVHHREMNVLEFRPDLRSTFYVWLCLKFQVIFSDFVKSM